MNLLPCRKMRFHPQQSRFIWKLLAYHYRQSLALEQGSAMIVVSIVTVLMFSLLGAALLATDLSRKSSIAFADNFSSFYSAESGLNRRAEKLRRQFLGFAQPDGTAPTSIGNCINSTGGSGDGDFGCETDTFNSSEQQVKQQENNLISSNTNRPYLAYTYVQPNPHNLATFPALIQIPAGELFAGLTAQEYSYRLFSTAIRRVNGEDLNSRREAQTVLQMDFNSRVIPLFQFGAFYQNDLEISPSPPMSLNGRIHTNGNLILRPDVSLSLEGPVTVHGNIYNTLPFDIFQNTSAGTVDFTRFDPTGNLISPRTIVPDSLGNPLTLTTSLSFGNTALNPSSLSRFGDFLRNQASVLQIPAASFLRKVDTSQPGSIGEYYGKADLQLEFLPSETVPFKLTAIKTGMTGGGCSGVTISSERLGAPWQCSVLNEGQLRSLQQPVLVRTTDANQAAYFCPSLPTPPTVGALRQLQVVRALQTAILTQSTPVIYSELDSSLSGGLKTSFSTYLDLIGTITPTEKTALLASQPVKIAAIAGGCFLPPAIQAIQNNAFRDQREGRFINLLQVNVRSLTAWNYYNISVDWAANVMTNHYGGQGTSSDELLFQRAPVNPSVAVGSSFRSLAADAKSFAAADRGEGGLVVHATIDKTANPYPAKQSIYGFAITHGSNLPAPLNVVSDQAIYLQGDYNTIDKQPAAIMADTITMMSNACWDDDAGVTGSTTNKCGRPTFGDKGFAQTTAVNAAFLTNTLKTNTIAQTYSGGLHNYMRFVENWNGTPFRYSGSLVSLNEPQEFSGTWKLGSATNSGYYSPPQRNWSFDRTFEQFSGLPPLSPRVIYLQQRVFGRKY